MRDKEGRFTGLPWQGDCQGITVTVKKSAKGSCTFSFYYPHQHFWSQVNMLFLSLGPFGPNPDQLP